MLHTILLKLIHSFISLKIIINYGTAGAINTKLKVELLNAQNFIKEIWMLEVLDFKLGETPFDKVKEINNF